MDKQVIAKIFLIVLTVSVLVVCYLIFRPFLVEILAATILVSIFYTPYQWLIRRARISRGLASLIMCLLVALVVIIPVANFIVLAAQESVKAYDAVVRFANQTDTLPGFLPNSQIARTVYEYIIANDQLKETILQAAAKLNEWLVSGAGSFIAGTANFMISLLLIVFTMFFFFKDGQTMLERVMHWTPLPNKYDKEIFKKFRDVSYSTVLSTFVTAAAQGLTGAIGLMIVGVPAFFASIAMAFLSLLPYMGPALVWGPIAAYLIIIGKIWQGIFLIIWGGGLVGTIDNLIRAYIIKGKAEVHPIFVIFSILGGISLFGFWGVIFGPLIISLAVTVLHIYEMEYEKVLEK